MLSEIYPTLIYLLKAPRRPSICCSVGRGRCIIAFTFETKILTLIYNAVRHPDT